MYYKNTTMKPLLYNTLIGLGYSLNVCKVPCNQMKIKSRLLKEIPSAGSPYVKLNFEGTVKQRYNIENFDAFDFIVEVGSALGLWLGLSAVGIFDVLLCSGTKEENPKGEERKENQSKAQGKTEEGNSEN